MIMNKFTGKVLFLSAVLCFLSAPAGEVSRKTDFVCNVSQDTQGNKHGDWSYFIAPDYFQYFDEKNKRLDYGKLLDSSKLRPVKSSGDMIFQVLERNAGNQPLSDYRISVESISLYWNYYPESPRTALFSSAIVIKYHITKDGVYSLRGNLSYLSETPAKNAILAIGVEDKSNFKPLFTHTFGQETAAGEAKMLKALDQEPALQDMKLAAGDQIIFVIGSAPQNNLLLSVIDDNVRIVSNVLPTSKVIFDKSRILSQLDFAIPGLSEVKTALDAGKIDEAFDQYKSILADKVLLLPPVKQVGYWNQGSAKADELLNGILTTGHYGLPGYTTYTIGKPGNVDWFKMPEDGYDVILRDITTMHWTNKLAEAYAKTGDKRYLDSYLGYWCDFADNWYPRFQEKMRDPKFRGLLGGSISWSANSRLYNAWRLEAISNGLQLILRRAKADNALTAISNDQLATLLKHLYFWEIPRSMRFLLAGGGVPNQQQQLAGGMFFFSILLSDMKGAQSWRKAALSNVINEAGYLPDGTDMEQSFNYNKGLPATLEHYINLAPALSIGERGDWVTKLEEQAKYRHYFLHSIVMPMGGQPICGANNIWNEYEKQLKFMPGITDANNSIDFGKYRLSAVIKDRFYGEKKLPEPAFRSVYFPYGGYYALRSDWSPDALYNFMKVSRPGRGHMREGNSAVVFSAFGRQLLINSGSNGYNPKTAIKDYGYSSISQNTVAVDGFGQKLNLEAAPPAAYESPLNYRFLDGRHFSFAEGTYDRLYSGWNFLDTKLKDQQVIRDVKHKRQILLLRDEKIWIVTDILTSEQEHRFTQIWNFPPDFKENEVNAKDGVICTSRPDNVNVALYQFLDGKLDYDKYYGFNKDGRTLGWVALPSKETGLDVTPAVDLHSSWRSKGEKILITVIVPFKADNPVKSIKPLRQGKAEGVELTLKDGRIVEYLYGTGKAEATLKTPEATLSLLPGGGYEEDAKSRERLPVIVPTGFRWDTDGNSEKPDYIAK